MMRSDVVEVLFLRDGRALKQHFDPNSFTDLDHHLNDRQPCHGLLPLPLFGRVESREGAGYCKS